MSYRAAARVAWGMMLAISVIAFATAAILTGTLIVIPFVIALVGTLIAVVDVLSNGEIRRTLTRTLLRAALLIHPPGELRDVLREYVRAWSMGIAATRTNLP